MRDKTPPKSHRAAAEGTKAANRKNGAASVMEAADFFEARDRRLAPMAQDRGARCGEEVRGKADGELAPAAQGKCGASRTSRPTEPGGEETRPDKNESRLQ